MPQDTPDSVSPLAPFDESYAIPGFDLTRRWFDGHNLTIEMRDELLELIRVAFNGRPSWFALPVSPEDHLDWKLRDNPLGTSVVLSVEPGGRSIGFIGRVRRVWLIRGRPYVARFGYDHCQLPDWQGRGLQRALVAGRELEWHPSEDFTFGEWAHPADRHLAIERGNRAPANVAHDYVRLLHPFQKLRALLSRARPTEDPDASTARSNTRLVIREREQGRADELRHRAHRSVLFATSLLARRPAPRVARWGISTISRFEEHHAPFIADALGQFDFVGDRSIPYLNWRFCDERAGPFTVRVAQQDGEFLGYAVTRVFNGAAFIADILALPGQEDVAESLIRDAVVLAKNGGAEWVRARLPKRHPYRPALARAGFFDVGHVAGELVEPRRPKEDDFSFLDRDDVRIHYVYADSDF